MIYCLWFLKNYSNLDFRSDLFLMSIKQEP